MASYVSSPIELILALLRQDVGLKGISTLWSKFKDSDFVEALRALTLCPNVITDLSLRGNRLTDTTGVKIAEYIANDDTIDWLDMEYNCISDKTRHAIAIALRRNYSLTTFYLSTNYKANRKDIGCAFVNTLRLNPCWPITTTWILFDGSNASEFPLLMSIAEKSTSPSMLEFLLCVHFDTKNFPTKKH